MEGCAVSDVSHLEYFGAETLAASGCVEVSSSQDMALRALGENDLCWESAKDDGSPFIRLSLPRPLFPWAIVARTWALVTKVSTYHSPNPESVILDDIVCSDSRGTRQRTFVCELEYGRTPHPITEIEFRFLREEIGCDDGDEDPPQFLSDPIRFYGVYVIGHKTEFLLPTFPLSMLDLPGSPSGLLTQNPCEVMELWRIVGNKTTSLVGGVLQVSFAESCWVWKIVGESDGGPCVLRILVRGETFPDADADAEDGSIVGWTEVWKKSDSQVRSFCRMFECRAVGVVGAGCTVGPATGSIFGRQVRIEFGRFQMEDFGIDFSKDVMSECVYSLQLVGHSDIKRPVSFE